MFKGEALVAAAIALTLILGVEATGVPQPSCSSYTPFKYAGCFKDQSTPTTALIYRSPLSSQNMTVEICTAFCKGNNYQYAGLEYYGECFCGASVNGPQVDESFCSYPCDGDKTEICGGFDYVSVYQDPTYPVDDTTTIADYQPLGCYSETTNGRTLAWEQNQLNATTLTVEQCLYACKDGGYPLAGVEYGQECWCGVVLGNGTAPVDASSCNMQCKGDSTETCGGRSLLNIYVAQDIESTQPCNGGSPPSSSSLTSSYPSSSPTSTTSTSSTSSAPTDNATSSTSSTSSISSTWTDSSTSSTPTDSSTSSIPTTSSTYSPPTDSSTSSTPTTSSTPSISTDSSTSSIPTTSSTSSIAPTTSSTTSDQGSITSIYPPPLSSTTSITSTSSTPPSITSTYSRPPPSTTSLPQTTLSTKTSASLCTTTTTIAPKPTCEYSCGNWCSNPIPEFSDTPSCLSAVSSCSIQLSSCFLTAGWPNSLDCFKFASYCSSIQNFCTSDCPGNSCSASNCRSKNPPAGYTPPSSTVSTVVYACTTTPSAPTASSSAATSVPVPTASNICTQPSNPSSGYSSTSPVGGIVLPCLTCNNIYSSYVSNPFKLYTSSDSQSCKSYKAGNSGTGSVGQGCKDACDAQYDSCVDTYAQSCKGNSWWGGKDTYSTAAGKCSDQWRDCYSANQDVSGSGKCGGWNKGW